MIKEDLVMRVRTKVYKDENHVKEMVVMILDYFAQTNDVFHFPIGASMFGKGGTSDRLACFNGWFIAIESKFGNRKVRGNQIEFFGEHC